MFTGRGFRDTVVRAPSDLRRSRRRFVNWYTHEPHHTGLGLHTPADVHHGLAAKADQRATTLTAARATHPERFATQTPPKMLDLPQAAWINPPARTEQPPAA